MKYHCKYKYNKYSCNIFINLFISIDTEYFKKDIISL